MKYAFINGILMDGTLGLAMDGTATMHQQKDRVILVDGDTITGIVGRDDDISGYEIVDLGGQYVVPGLINLHVHLPASGEPKKKKTDPVKLVRILTATPLRRKIVDIMCQGYAKTQMLSGATTIRTVGGVLDTDTRLRDRIASGKADGPRILAADMAVSVPGGHMANSLAYAAKSVSEAEEDTRRILAGRPDLLKLMITGGVIDAKVKGEPGELKMPPEMVKACCDIAHAAGLPVAAHVESPEGVKVALENGVDTIEHGAEPDDEMIALFKERGAAFVATITPALPFALMDSSVTGFSEDDRYNGNVVFEGGIACAQACLHNGIPVGMGTDTGCEFSPQYGMWREVALFAKYVGVNNAFALHTATKINAQIAGIGDICGTIEPGKSADMIVCRKDPLADLRALGELSMVIARGKIFRDPKYKKFPLVEQEMNRYL